MKRIVFLLLLILSIGCEVTKTTPSHQITTYYEGFKNGNYAQVKETLADSLITINGDFTTIFSRESYHEQFKWDSIFKPVYKLVNIANNGKQPVATVAVSSLKFEFLKNNPLTFRSKFYFRKGKITKIESVGFIDADFEIWQSELTSLIEWVKTNHPELDGFHQDLTMQGAINYLNAVEHYKQRRIQAAN